MKIKSTIFLLFFTLLLWGCMEEIVMDPGERTVVVECVIDNEDKIQTVNLSYSATVSDKTYPKVEEAVVRMSFALDTFYTDFEDGHTVIVDTSGCHEFVKVADGVWQAEFEPIEYAQYTLEVEVPGYDRITATTVFPPKMKIHVGGYTWGGFAYEVYSYNNRKIWIYGRDYNPSTLQYETADYIYASDRYVDNFNLTEVTKDDIEEFRRPENLDMDALLYGDPPRSPGYSLFIWEQDWTPYLSPLVWQIPGLIYGKKKIGCSPHGPTITATTSMTDTLDGSIPDRSVKGQYIKNMKVILAKQLLKGIPMLCGL